MEIPKGFCQCGCGKLTTIAKKTSKRSGAVKGEPHRFVYHHCLKVYGPQASRWNGGVSIANGYRLLLQPNHPRADSRGYVREHILIAERTLGKLLPIGAIVHHANGSRNSGPLVICQDRSYHHLLHQRMRAKAACGHANWRKCTFCKQWDDPQHLIIARTQAIAFHRECQRIFDRGRIRKKRPRHKNYLR